jgi:hypothetical protein
MESNGCLFVEANRITSIPWDNNYIISSLEKIYEKKEFECLIDENFSM